MDTEPRRGITTFVYLASVYLTSGPHNAVFVVWEILKAFLFTLQLNLFQISLKPEPGLQWATSPVLHVFC